ncbi:hypothetical protein [uncultured Schumannella sp.]|uniref:BP74-related protein n=1 Tax=uncultured Schumannella sp. TaxID=1195956 RepID=UPI0025E4D2B5|nr:hypothetical protein [uncultured Schumannella sp.]
MIRGSLRGRLAAAGAVATALALAACTPAEQHPVATFAVAGGETYRIELVTPDLVNHAERLLAGEQVAAIPVGTVVRDDPGVNEPWSWHIDPTTLQFADITIEVCDGLPSYVEDGTITSDQFCPWSAEIVSID